MRQLPLQFPATDLSFDTLAVTDTNRAAVHSLRAVERWPQNTLCLIGAQGSGLTTLARAWCQQRGATYISLEDTNGQILDPAELEGRDVTLDGADTLCHGETLLMLLTAALRNKTYVLLCARSAPAQWPLASADLLSRLKSVPLVQLGPPDEALFRARLRQGFERAYLHLSQNVEDYLVSRLGLDYSMLEDVIETVAGEAANRPVTIPMVRRVLGLSQD